MPGEYEILVHKVLSDAADGFTHLNRPLKLPADENTIQKAMQEAQVNATKRPFTSCGCYFGPLNALNGKIRGNWQLDKLNGFARYLQTLTKSERAALCSFAARHSALTPIECMTDVPEFSRGVTRELTVAIYPKVFLSQPAAGYMHLPATAEELRDAFDRGRCTGSYFFAEPLASRHSYIIDALRERPCGNIYELNFLAGRLSELDDTEHFILRAMIQMEKEPPSAARIINLSHNLEHCVLAPAKDMVELGRFAVEGSFYPEFDAIPDEMLDTLEYGAIGLKFMNDQKGVLLDGVFVANLADENEMDFPYHGEYSIIDSDYDHVLRLLLAVLPENGKEVWLDLPAGEVEMAQMAKRLGVETLDGYEFISCRSAVPQINRILTGKESIAMLSDLAEELLRAQNEGDLPKVKAVLEYKSCANLAECVEVLTRFDCYDFQPEMVSGFDIGEMRMIELYGINRFSEGMEHFDFTAYGEEWMEQAGIVNTPYGMVSKAGVMPEEGQGMGGISR